MVEIRNRKFQPLTLHLANSKRSVHLPSRGRTEIADNDVSAEMRRAAERGFITLREVAARPTQVAAPLKSHPKPVPAKAEPKVAASHTTPTERS